MFPLHPPSMNLDHHQLHEQRQRLFVVCVIWLESSFMHRCLLLVYYMVVVYKFLYLFVYVFCLHEQCQRLLCLSDFCRFDLFLSFIVMCIVVLCVYSCLFPVCISALLFYVLALLYFTSSVSAFLFCMCGV